ncbi:SOS response-associated peptidase family protein [Marinicella sp. W31]|uniref:SOS response-associated peptidase family protein n=1 Tax=Marinicella sp. W31 TaxID=3023713 RepID=UPI0037564247
MCGAFDIQFEKFTASIADALDVEQFENRGIRVPASMIQIVRDDKERGREVVDAKWWLMLGADAKPNYKYATFNSRYDKLYSSRLTKGLFKTSRCIIPATGVIEGQNKIYHHIIDAKNRGLALGGIYKTYCYDDEIQTTASIITCPGNPKWEDIHKKSVPLMLDPNDKDTLNAWLDPTMTDSEAFSDLLTNEIRFDLVATKTVGARDLTPDSEPIYIEAD